MKYLIILCSFFVAIPLFASSTKASNITLYQPDSILKERVSNVNSLAQYIQKVQNVCDTAFSGEEKEGADIVIILKPSSKSRAWFVSSLEKKPDRTKLKAIIEAIAVPNISGVIAFAISYDLNGFIRPKPMTGKYEPPMPSEWTASMKENKQPLIIPDGLIPYVWPD